jgi:hypothetical protein
VQKWRCRLERMRLGLPEQQALLTPEKHQISIFRRAVLFDGRGAPRHVQHQ